LTNDLLSVLKGGLTNSPHGLGDIKQKKTFQRRSKSRLQTHKCFFPWNNMHKWINECIHGKFLIGWIWC